MIEKITALEGRLLCHLAKLQVEYHVSENWLNENYLSCPSEVWVVLRRGLKETKSKMQTIENALDDKPI